MKAQVKKIGNWKPIEEMIVNLNRMMSQSRKQSLMLWALYAEGTAKEHIANQDLSWRPLRPYTIERKKRLNYPLEIMVETSTYFQAITSWVYGGLNDSEMVALAGVRANRVYHTGQNKNRRAITVDYLARLHEYGSAANGLPARPLWQPTYDETMQWYLSNKNVRPDYIFLRAVEARYGMYVRRGGIGGKHLNF